VKMLIMLLERDSAWSPITWAIQQGGERGVGGQIMIERQLDWLSVLHDNHILNEYDDHELSKLSGLLVDPTPFLLEWKGSGLIEALLQSVPAEIGAVVDNDHGLLASLQGIRSLPLESWIRASA